MTMAVLIVPLFVSFKLFTMVINDVLDVLMSFVWELIDQYCQKRVTHLSHVVAGHDPLFVLPSMLRLTMGSRPRLIADRGWFFTCCLMACVLERSLVLLWRIILWLILATRLLFSTVHCPERLCALPRLFQLRKGATGSTWLVEQGDDRYDGGWIWWFVLFHVDRRCGTAFRFRSSRTTMVR